MKILVTGAAGFIGAYVVRRLVERADEVVGLDNINDYYDVGLKYAWLKEGGFYCSDRKSLQNGGGEGVFADATRG